MDAHANVNLSSAATDYLSRFQFAKRPRSYESAAQIIGEFVTLFPDKLVGEITRDTVSQHLRALEQSKQHSKRTLANKFVRISAFLKDYGVRIPSKDRPRFPKQPVTIYEEKELERLFQECDVRQLALYKTLLMTGIRKEEARWLQWSDIDKGILTVQPHLPNFQPKTYETRRIPMPQSLVSLLNQLEHRPGSLVFPTQSGLSDPHMLRTCKRIGARAGFDSAHWTLHKFRRTYCTTLLRRGVDLATVQRLMGHSNLQSTMRYLRPQDAEQIRGRVSEIFG